MSHFLLGMNKRGGTWASEQHNGVLGNSLQIAEAKPRHSRMRWRAEEDDGNLRRGMKVWYLLGPDKLERWDSLE